MNPISVDKPGANATRAGAGCGWWSCIVYSVYEVFDLSYAAMHGPQRTGGRLPSLPGQGHVMVRSWSWGGRTGDTGYHAVYTVYCVDTLYCTLVLGLFMCKVSPLSKCPLC